MSNVVGRMHGGKVKFTQVSEFISAVLKDDIVRLFISDSQSGR